MATARCLAGCLMRDEKLQSDHPHTDLCVRGGQSWPRDLGVTAGQVGSAHPREFTGVASLLNLRPYREVLSDRRAVAFSLAGFVARLPLSMTGIGIVLLVSLTTGSFGLAGLLTAAGTVTGAVVAPLWGRAIDRVGQARVLLAAAVINLLSVALLVTAIELAWPLAVSVAAAIGVGVGFSMAGSAVRARWTLRLDGSPLLNTAFALEAMLDEVVFIIGPVLVTFLATAFHPALGISVSAVIGFIGAVALAVQRSTQPPDPSRRRGMAVRDHLGCRGVSWSPSPSRVPLSAWCSGVWRSMSSLLPRRRCRSATPA